MYIQIGMVTFSCSWYKVSGFMRRNRRKKLRQIGSLIRVRPSGTQVCSGEGQGGGAR